MIDRCRNKNKHNSHRYVERGITVCGRWLSFDNFVADMGERPNGTTLDRIDNDNGYFPGNCRWATPQEQSQNRAPRRKGLKRRSRSPRYKDRSGVRHNSLTFVSFVNSDGKRTYWLARCDCGNSKVFDASDVARGHIKSCGCSQFVRPTDAVTGQWVKR